MSSLLYKNACTVALCSVWFIFSSLPSAAYAQTNSVYEVSKHPQCQVGNTEVCVKFVIQEMERRLKKLGCDHDAIFAFTYLATTKTFLDTAYDIGYEDLSSVVREDSLFADYYFLAYDAYVAGDDESLPPAWKIAFDTSSNKQLFSFGNALVGISAHINNDLPQVLFDLYLDGNPVSKVDNFLVNDFWRRYRLMLNYVSYMIRRISRPLPHPVNLRLLNYGELRHGHITKQWPDCTLTVVLVVMVSMR